METVKVNLGKVSITVEKDYHSSEKEYDKLVIVEQEGTFKTFISRKPVPLGVQLSNRDYWIPFSKVDESIVIDYETFKQNYATGNALFDNSIKTRHITDENVTTDKLADEAVTTDKLDDESVTTSKIADGNVTTDKIADSNITTDKIADENVTTEKIADTAITEDKISNGAVTEDKIADEAIKSKHIAAGQIESSHIGEGEVKSNNIAENNIETKHINDEAIVNRHIGEKAVQGSNIDDAAIDSNHIKSSAIETSHIKDGNVITDKIADSAITTGKLADNAVTSSKIKDDEIGESKLTEALRNKIASSTDPLTGVLVCATPGNESHKNVSYTGFKIRNDIRLLIKFNNTNSVDDVTLNINNTGAKPLYFNGVAASQNNHWLAGDILDVYYDGTNYQAALRVLQQYLTQAEYDALVEAGEISNNVEYNIIDEQ